jgi:hypothetical protein
VRILLVEGRHVDIHHPDLVTVGRHLTIRFPDPEKPTVYACVTRVALA